MEVEMAPLEKLNWSSRDPFSSIFHFHDYMRKSTWKFCDRDFFGMVSETVTRTHSMAMLVTSNNSVIKLKVTAAESPALGGFIV